MDSKLNMEGCTSLRKLIHRPEAEESASGGFHEVKQIKKLEDGKFWGCEVFGLKSSEKDTCTSFLMLHNKLTTKLVT